MEARRTLFAVTVALFGIAALVVPPAYADEAKPEGGAAENAAVEKAPEPLPTAGYDKGLFLRSSDGKFELKLKLRVHALYAFASKDEGEGEDRAEEMNFSASVARLTMGGKAFCPALEYMFEADFGKGFVKLLAAYADYAIVPKTLHLRAGMWKRPFARQFILSSGKNEMVERSFVNGYFGEGYDIGLALHNNYTKSPPFEWAVGVFNGDYKNKYPGDKSWFSGSGTLDPDTGAVTIGSGSFSNVPKKFHPALVARAGINLGGIDGYSEADLEGGGFRLALAANVLADLDYDDDNLSGVRAGIDFLMKMEGLSLSGAVFAATGQKAPETGSDTGFLDQEYRAVGFYLQTGYLISGKIQPVVRYSLASPKGQKSAQEVSAGLSLYLEKHNFKWQLLGGALINQAALTGRSTGDDRVDYRVLTHIVFSL